MDPIIRSNAEKDTRYAPYCMRCPGLVRMKKVEPFYWKCSCGAEHDERDYEGAAGRARDAAACPTEADRVAVLARAIEVSSEKWCAVCHDTVPLAHDTAHPFVCATCGKSAPDTEGGADDFPNDCAECWALKLAAGAPSERGHS